MRFFGLLCVHIGTNLVKCERARVCCNTSLVLPIQMTRQIIAITSNSLFPQTPSRC